MCDFRQINKIKILDTSEIIDLENEKYDWVEWGDYCNNNFPHPGFFHIVATGMFSVYWNGERILKEGADYTVIDWSEYKPIYQWMNFKEE